MATDLELFCLHPLNQLLQMCTFYGLILLSRAEMTAALPKPDQE